MQAPTVRYSHQEKKLNNYPSSKLDFTKSRMNDLKENLMIVAIFHENNSQILGISN